MLDASELVDMRSTASASLPDSAQIQRATRSADGQGGFTGGYSNHGSAVACLLSPAMARAQEGIEGGNEQLLSLARWDITVPQGTDVTVDDRIVVNTRTFRVIEVNARSYELGRRVHCEEIS